MLEMSGDVLLADGNPLRQLTRSRRSAQQFLADRLSYRLGPLHLASMQRAHSVSISLGFGKDESGGDSATASVAPDGRPR